MTTDTVKRAIERYAAAQRMLEFAEYAEEALEVIRECRWALSVAHDTIEVDGTTYIVSTANRQSSSTLNPSWYAETIVFTVQPDGDRRIIHKGEAGLGLRSTHDHIVALLTTEGAAALEDL